MDVRLILGQLLGWIILFLTGCAVGLALTAITMWDVLFWNWIWPCRFIMVAFGIAAVIWKLIERIPEPFLYDPYTGRYIGGSDKE